MILVADSGSSKTDWILQLPNSEILEFTTKGINPFYLSEKEIIRIVNNSEIILAHNTDVTEVYFFGAGCSSPDRREVVSNALSQIFKDAFISVESNLLGSVYATCGKEKGLTCILGTGSNIAYHDGSEVYFGRHGLGFILGDEGSATYFGKILVTSYLYGNLPRGLARDFKNTYKLSKDTVMSAVYQKATPNLYLASFVKFLILHKSHPFIQEMLVKGFNDYIKTCIQPYPQHKTVPCHFVGTLAYYFQDILIEVCKNKGIRIGKILNHTIRDLYHFILERELQSS